MDFKEIKGVNFNHTMVACGLDLRFRVVVTLIVNASLPTVFCFLPTAFRLLLLPSATAFCLSRNAGKSNDPPGAFGYGSVVFVFQIAVGKEAGTQRDGEGSCIQIINDVL